MYTPQQYTEIFHLLFIRHLESKLSKKLYALKGGCNLRFFFKSIRYSQDIDFDTKTIAKETLRHKISTILKSLAFEQNLYIKGIEINHLSEPKQTPITQRWKIHLRISGLNLPIPTKIEFSRRTMDEKTTLFEPIDTELIHTYQVFPILANHYTAEAAFSQKISALIHRTETQARDIFDLYLLMPIIKRRTNIKSRFSKSDIERAIENIATLGFKDFKGQVVAYLMADYQNYYNSEKIWNEIQTKVTINLSELKQ